ncbi:MAG: Hsp70 family protein [Alphaproteobacteria bacterium]|nr:Hsp70 family protein [Alphaproteobacteria bacterium]
MKLFQIEEPEGAPLSAEGPGAAVGIDLAATSAAVAIALGGNAEILPGTDGERRLATAGQALDAVLLALRARAEKQLARSVTHAVIATPDGRGGAALETAAKTAGLTVLRVVAQQPTAAGRDTGPDAAALGAARIAEDLSAALGITSPRP